VFGIWILIGMFFLGMVFKPLKKAAESIPSRHQLKTYRYWLAVLEKEQMESPLLKDKQAPFLTKGVKASTLFDQLDSLGLWIQNRINLLYIPINFLFWTDLFLYVKLVSWKKKYGHLVADFPAQLIEWEVLISLGAFENEVGGKGKVISVTQGMEGSVISHPLLEPGVAVPNDFVIDENRRIILLTGANMSGKTTFMRTLGINCVLVNLGLSPFAQEFGFSGFQLYTSMRNTDNLGESVSSFYAELSRIKQLIDRIEKGEQIFFLLDEILKGTNTEDRIAGSEALIRQVDGTRALGIISTHDIELAELEERIDSVENYSFHSEIHDQNIDFDYKIKRGACPSFNAHKLMELMGIRFQNEK
jgi:DNA mismatch repair ATPase MutS